MAREHPIPQANPMHAQPVLRATSSTLKRTDGQHGRAALSQSRRHQRPRFAGDQRLAGPAHKFLLPLAVLTLRSSTGSRTCFPRSGGLASTMGAGLDRFVRSTSLRAWSSGYRRAGGHAKNVKSRPRPVRSALPGACNALPDKCPKTARFGKWGRGPCHLIGVASGASRPQGQNSPNSRRHP